MGRGVKKMRISCGNIMTPPAAHSCVLIPIWLEVTMASRKHYGFHTGLGPDLGYRSSSITH